MEVEKLNFEQVRLTRNLLVAHMRHTKRSDLEIRKGLKKLREYEDALYAYHKSKFSQEPL